MYSDYDEELKPKQRGIDIVTAIKNNQPLALLDETLALAKRVASMEKDDRTIEEWASDLAKDISKGND